ncbi:MAG: nuclear transport factor 2 family protein [Beijerinckiaceae bacterium]|nr:nuclear transport factor 2 family protein [Beijerinckiaceae bacterium]
MTLPKTPNPADYVEIMNLYAIYNLASDEADAELYAQCFTATGILEIGKLAVRVEGRDNLKLWKERDRARRGTKYRRHWNSGVHLEQLQTDSVRGRCYLVAYNGVPNTLPSIVDCGTYDDLLVKEDGLWRFARRHLALEATTFQLDALQ